MILYDVNWDYSHRLISYTLILATSNVGLFSIQDFIYFKYYKLLKYILRKLRNVCCNQLYEPN